MKKELKKKVNSSSKQHVMAYCTCTCTGCSLGNMYLRADGLVTGRVIWV